MRNRDTDKTGPQLYDLNNDISEAHNVAGQNPAIVKSLLEKLQAWENTLVKPLW